MRKATLVRVAAGAATALLGILSAAPAMSATTPGTIRVTGPTKNAILGDEAVITWAYTYGSVVTSTSHVYVQISSDNNHYRILGYALPIHSAYVWDTTGFPSGKYAVRVQVERTTTWSTTYPVIIDRDAPSVAITHPAAGEALGTGVTAPSSAAIVSGITTLTANASDALSGVADVQWFIDLDPQQPDLSNPIGDGATITYNFDQLIGPHTLTAFAIDWAGNPKLSVPRNLYAVPGPVGPLQNLGVLPPVVSPAPSPSPSASPPKSPSAVPSKPPSLPSLPSLPALP